jgi:hypothetical protein
MTSSNERFSGTGRRGYQGDNSTEHRRKRVSVSFPRKYPEPLHPISPSSPPPPLPEEGHAYEVISAKETKPFTDLIEALQYLRKSPIKAVLNRVSDGKKLAFVAPYGVAWGDVRKEVEQANREVEEEEEEKEDE